MSDRIEGGASAPPPAEAKPVQQFTAFDEDGDTVRAVLAADHVRVLAEAETRIEGLSAALRFVAMRYHTAAGHSDTLDSFDGCEETICAEVRAASEGGDDAFGEPPK